MVFEVGGKTSYERNKWEETTRPLSWQEGPIRDIIFPMAYGLMQRGPYQGPYWADMNQGMQTGYDILSDPRMYQQAAQTFNEAGQQYAGMMEPAAAYFQDLMKSGFSDYAPTMTPEYFNEYMSQVQNQPWVQQMINAGMADIDNQAMVSARNKIAAPGAATGNTSSSAAAVARAVAAGERDRNILNLGANVRGQAAGYGQQQALAGGQERFNYNLQDFQGKMTGAQNMMGLGQMGYDMMAMAPQLNAQAGHNAYLAGQNQLAYDQGAIQAAMQQYYAPWDILDRYNQLIAGRLYGSSTKGNSSKFYADAEGSFGF